MFKLSLPENPDLISILSEVKKSPEGEITLLLPPKTSLWNVLTLKTLSSKLGEWGKKVEFKAQNQEGEVLLAAFKGTPDKRKENRGIKIKKIKGAPIIIAGIIILTLTVAIFVLLPKAELKLVVNASPLVKITEVTVDHTIVPPDSKTGVLPAVKMGVEQGGSFEGDATGEKIVGSQANGEVTVYNYDTGEDWNFPKGSILETEGGFQFTLEEAISLEEASSSADPDDPTRREIDPDKIEVKLLAKEIGPTYNIGQGERLNLLDLEERFREDVYAVTKGAFSGGESRTVKTVQGGDQEVLLTKSVEELTSKCVDGLSGKLVGNQILEAKTVKSGIIEKIFSPALGEETEKIKLDLKINCEGLAYSKEQLDEILSGILKELVPEGFDLSPESQKIQILTVEAAPEGREGIVFQTKIEGRVIPKVDTEKIREAVRGRSFSDARAYLTTLPHINSYEINFWPPLPGKLRRLPFKKERINVTLNYN